MSTLCLFWFSTLSRESVACTMVDSRCVVGCCALRLELFMQLEPSRPKRVQKYRLSPALPLATVSRADFGVLDGQSHLDAFACTVERLCLFISVLECISLLQVT